MLNFKNIYIILNDILKVSLMMIQSRIFSKNNKFSVIVFEVYRNNLDLHKYFQFIQLNPARIMRIRT